MANPFKKHADESNRSKRGNMGKLNNLDIPIMKAVGENKRGGIYDSSSSQQHQKQTAATGMKKGGHVGKPRHHKPKAVAMVAPAPDPANPPMPDPAMAAAGAGSSPAPAPMPGAMPPAKRGGRMKYADGGRAPFVGGAVKATRERLAHPYKDGGKVMNKWQDAGVGSGEGRLENAKHGTK
jgi:hypothetical protein